MNNKIYKVIWTDASGVTDSTLSWLDIEQTEKEAKQRYDCKAVSVGFIIVRNKDFLVVAGCKGEDVYSDMTMIPMVMVEKIKELK